MPLQAMDSIITSSDFSLTNIGTEFMNFMFYCGMGYLVIHVIATYTNKKPVKIDEWGTLGINQPVIITGGPYKGQTGLIRMIIDKDPTGTKYGNANAAIDVYVAMDLGGVRIIDINHIETN